LVVYRGFWDEIWWQKRRRSLIFGWGLRRPRVGCVCLKRSPGDAVQRIPPAAADYMKPWPLPVSFLANAIKFFFFFQSSLWFHKVTDTESSFSGKAWKWRPWFSLHFQTLLWFCDFFFFFSSSEMMLSSGMTNASYLCNLSGSLSSSRLMLAELLDFSCHI